MNSMTEIENEPEVDSFDALDLSPVMRRALEKAGFEKPSPIQSSLIPLALEGLDVIGQARTGTGKTAAFSIPILEQLDSLEDCRDPQAIVIVPTRELADQVASEAQRLAWGEPTEIAVLAGGKNITHNFASSKTESKSSLALPGDSTIICNASHCVREGSGASYWTRRTGCSTSDSVRKSNVSSASARVIARLCCCPRRCRRLYDGWPSRTWSIQGLSTVAKTKWRSKQSSSVTSLWLRIAKVSYSISCSCANSRNRQLFFAAPNGEPIASTDKSTATMPIAAACMATCNNANETVCCKAFGMAS